MTLESAAPCWLWGRTGTQKHESKTRVALVPGVEGFVPGALTLCLSSCFLQPPSPASCAPTTLSGRPRTCRFGPARSYGSDGIHRRRRSRGLRCRACHGERPDQCLQWGKLRACPACGPAGEREDSRETEARLAHGCIKRCLRVQ